MTTIGHLAYLYNALEARHWHALKSLIRNELLVDYFTAFTTATNTPSPLQEIYEISLTTSRQAVEALELPDSAGRCQAEVRQIAASWLTTHLGLPQLTAPHTSLSASERAALATALTNEGISTIVGQAVEYAIAEHQWKEATLAIHNLYEDQREAPQLPPRPHASQWPHLAAMETQ